MTTPSYIRLADRSQDPILAGQVRSVVRLEFERDHSPGDQVDLVDEAGDRFATATVATVGEMTALEYVRQDHDHHRNYDTLAEFFDEIREFYPNADLYPRVRVHVIHFQDVKPAAGRFATDGGPASEWTERYQTTTYRGPQQFPVPGGWVLGMVEADGVSWNHYGDVGDQLAHDSEVMDAMDPDEYEKGPDAQAAILPEWPEQADRLEDSPYHELRIDGDVVLVLKDASEVGESEWWRAIAETLARYDRDGEYETVLADLGLEHLQADSYGERDDDDEDRSLDEFATDGGSDLVSACPECDCASIGHHSAGGMHAHKKTNPETYRCHNCGAGFDEPVERERRGGHYLRGDTQARALDDMEPGDLLPDGGSDTWTDTRDDQPDALGVDVDERWQELHEQPLEDLSDAEVTSKIKLSIRRRFDYPEWVLMYEYGAPGQNGSVCDCLAVNTLPSRNYKVIGFEFKASRSDWLREVRDGEKADYFVQLADEFYVVAPKGVVEDSEIPEGWGYLELKPNSEQLYKLQDSELTEYQQGEPGRRFWARFLKQTVGRDSNYTADDLAEARSRGYQDAKDQGITDRDIDRNLNDLRQKADSYDRLQDEFGFLPWREFDEDDAETLELATKLVREVRRDRWGFQGDIDRLREKLEFKSESMHDELDTLENAFGTLRDRVENADGALDDVASGDAGDIRDGGRDE